MEKPAWSDGVAVTESMCWLCLDYHWATEGIVHYGRYFECSRCGTEWYDIWCSDCNDRCPNCNGEIEPSESEVLEVIEEPSI
jgi:hypothetical protein